MENGSALLTQQKAAKFLGVSKKAVGFLVTEGKLNSVMIGGSLYIPYPSIAALLNINPTENIVTRDNGYPCAEEVQSPLTTSNAVNLEKGEAQTMAYKGSISKLSDGRFMVQIDLGKDENGKRQRYNKGFRNEVDATEHLRKKLNELNGAVAPFLAPAPSSPAQLSNSAYTPLTFEEYSLLYLKNGGSGKASSMTLENYRRGLSVVNPHIGKMQMAAITKEDLTKAFSKISYKYGDGVIQKAFSITRMVLQKAFDDGDIPRDPTRKWSKPKSRKPKKSEDEEYAVFSNEDLQTIFEKSLDYDLELYTQFTLLACTGMRPEELRALEWASFKPKNMTIDIHQAVVHVYDEVKEIGKAPKGHEEISVTKSEYSVRTLTLSNLAVKALLDWKKKLKADKNKAKANSPYIFPNREGSFKTSSGCENAVKRFRKRCGLTYLGIHFYKFRHTMCTNLILANQPIPVIQRIMGDNTTDVIMKIYTHVTGKKALIAAQGFYDDMNKTNVQLASGQALSA